MAELDAIAGVAPVESPGEHDAPQLTEDMTVKEYAKLKHGYRDDGSKKLFDYLEFPKEKGIQAAKEARESKRQSINLSRKLDKMTEKLVNLETQLQTGEFTETVETLEQKLVEAAEAGDTEEVLKYKDKLIDISLKQNTPTNTPKEDPKTEVFESFIDNNPWLQDDKNEEAYTRFTEITEDLAFDNPNWTERDILRNAKKQTLEEFSDIGGSKEKQDLVNTRQQYSPPIGDGRPPGSRPVNTVSSISDLKLDRKGQDRVARWIKDEVLETGCKPKEAEARYMKAHREINNA